MTLRYFLAILALAPTAAAPPNTNPQIVYHQHLVSPATSALISQPGYDGAALIRDLDEAGISRAVVLSMGYTYADERKAVPDPDRHVREENDWTAAEVAKSGGRLIGFCSVNPLREAAQAEIARCTRLSGMRGLKLHFGNSGVNLRDPEHADKLAAVFALANRLGVPIVVHMRARTGSLYGVEDAQLFIERLLAVAPTIVVQVAHLGGSGRFPEDAKQVMKTFAEAIARDDPRTRNLIFDLTTVATSDSTAIDGEEIARAIRAVGVKRIVFGTDLPVGGNPHPAQAWATFCAKVPLTESEIATVAANVVSYARADPARPV